jgi:hypothetical protein
MVVVEDCEPRCLVLRRERSLLDHPSGDQAHVQRVALLLLIHGHHEQRRLLLHLRGGEHVMDDR